MRIPDGFRALGLVLVATFLVADGARAEEPDDESPAVGMKALEGRLEEMRKELEELRRKSEEDSRAQREAIEALKARLAETEDEGLDSELDRLLRAAEEESTGGLIEETPGDTTFISRGLGLQALNPEFSVVGDFLMEYRDGEDEPSMSDFRVRVLDIHVESYLDPYSQIKAAVGVNEEKAVLGEGYFTRFGLLPHLNLTAGKFRQQFGIVNRWHKHALDQVDFPLPLRAIFGEGGLNQTGFSLDWSMPEFLGGSQRGMLQITDGQNSRVFGENSRNLPSLLLRYSHFRDLNKDIWLEAGVTGLYGWNDEWEVLGEIEHDRLSTWVLGADLTLRWEPTGNMRYANMEWRTEFYHLTKGILAPDGSGSDEITAWGAYTYLQRKLSRTVDVGVRLDYYRPDSKSYARPGGFIPLAYEGSGPYQWQAVPYFTWWQSPFVRVRLEADYLDGHNTGPRQLVVFLQITFAAGPHKHERY